jgi:hypothetical protein
LTAEHVSSDIIAHHLELLNCNYNLEATDDERKYLSLPTATTKVSKTRSCNYNLEAPDDER